MLPLASWVLMVLARVPLLWVIWKNPAACVTTDSYGYLLIARNLAQHAVFSESAASPWVPATFRVPAYPLFLSFFVSVFKDPVPWIAGTQILISLGTVVILERWLCMLASPLWSAWVATLIGIDLMTLLHVPLILTETFFSLTLVVALWGTGKALHEASARKTFGCGALWSLALITRPIAFYFPPIIALIWIKNKKLLLSFILGAYLLPGLWVIRNWKVTGHPVYSTQGGYELLRCPGAAVESLRTGVPWSIVWPALLEKLNRRYPNDGSVAYERSRLAGRMAKDIIIQHPFLLVRHCLLGVVKTLGASSLILPVRWVDPSFSQDTSLQTRPRFSENFDLLRHYKVLIPLQVAYSLYLLFFYVYWIKGLHALWTTGRRQEAWLLFAGVAYFVALASVEGQGRYRIPIMPFLAGAAAVGWTRRRDT